MNVNRSLDREFDSDLSRPTGSSRAPASWLWGESSSIILLLAISAVVLFVKLGAAELWTHEGRWAAVCSHMMRSGDYLHPYLYGAAYYDKPVLSYWLMIGAARLFGRLSETALRLPSALAGLLSLWCVYRLGRKRFDKTTGLMAAALLASCFMFVFWARVASADMLNVAGTLGAVTWYFERRDQPGFVTFTIFFVILAVTCLMKGLVGPAVALLVLLPDLARQGRWRTMIRPSLAPSILIAAAVYLAPFVASSISTPEGYEQSGLAMVFRENAVRYFDAFDHEEPFYIYLVDLPVYLLPWSLLLPFVVWANVRQWRSLSEASRWPSIACLLVLALLTASGSRRSYYVLPVVPLAVLMIADWLRADERRARWEAGSAWVVLIGLVLLFSWFAVVVPLGFRHGGERILAREVRLQAEKTAPWGSWKILICGAPPAVGYYFATDNEARVIPAEDAKAVQAELANDPHTIVVTKRRFLEDVRSHVPSATMFTERSRIPSFLRSRHGSDRDLIAFVP